MSSPLRVEKGEPAPVKAAGPAAEPEPKEKKSGARRIIILTVLAVLAIAGGIYGTKTITFYRHHATTDDAQLDGNIDPVLPRVPGYVREVLVHDNQPVAAGDVLVRIDPADLQAKVDQEQAALANAESAVAVAEAAVAGTQARGASARADVATARTRQAQTAADLTRYKALWAKEEISQQQYDAARAAADAARSAVEADAATAQGMNAQVESSRRQVTAAQAQVAQHRATLEAARLQLSYATLTAPVAGTVAKKNIEVGQFVQAGQPLLAIVEGQDSWVVANFKETQLARMHPDQRAEVEVDAYPGVTFHGKIESLSAATGAKFSLLPPDNATGNFTKVVQRVPVKIVFTDPPDPKRPLRVGMSVSVIVDLDA